MRGELGGANVERTMKAFIEPTVVLLAAVSLTCPAAAQEKVKAIPDRDFLAEASAWAFTGGRLTDLGAKQSDDDKLKEAAPRLGKEFTKLGDKLREFAVSMTLNLSPGLPESVRRRFDKLAELKGADFNREYTRLAVDVHENLVRLFEAKATDSQNADLKAYAAKTLPALKEQLKEARSAAERFKQ
jgi:putative membrane protein